MRLDPLSDEAMEIVADNDRLQCVSRHVRGALIAALREIAWPRSPTSGVAWPVHDGADGSPGMGSEARASPAVERDPPRSSSMRLHAGRSGTITRSRWRSNRSHRSPRAATGATSLPGQAAADTRRDGGVASLEASRGLCRPPTAESSRELKQEAERGGQPGCYGCCCTARSNCRCWQATKTIRWAGREAGLRARVSSLAGRIWCLMDRADQIVPDKEALNGSGASNFLTSSNPLGHRFLDTPQDIPTSLIAAR